MRKLLLAILLLVPVSGYGVVNCFAHVTVRGGGVPSSPINTTGASLLIFVVNAGNATFNIGDSKSNIWSQGTTRGSGVPHSTIGYVKNPITDTAQTFETLLGVVTPVGTVWACSGTATTGGISSENGIANAGSGTFQTGSVSYTAGDLVVTGVCSNGVASTAAIDSSFATPVGDGTDGADEVGWASILVTTTGTSVNPTWTMQHNTDWAGTIGVFAQAPAAPTMIKRGGTASWH